MVNTDRPRAVFEQVFPGATPRVLVRAPGRVNLIGEHTDYNDGWVLPIAMSQSLYVIAGPSEGTDIVAHSTAFGETIAFPAGDPGTPGEPAWGNYVRGVAALLLKNGIRLKPGRLVIHSDVPIGGGVSSSAALEVGTAMALLALAGRTMEAAPLALLAQQAEHQYARSPCGIMDQFICLLGKAGHALLLDCRSQAYEHVPLPFDGAVLVVMDTRVKHTIGSSQYPIRQRQCREGLAIIQQSHPEVKALRDVSPEVVNECRNAIGPLIFQHCLHVVTEIQRTTRAADALRSADLNTFGQLMFASHLSLRDNYAVSCPELDRLVEVARRVPGVYGARMTGGGFGGCAIALAKKECESALREAVAREYDTRFDKPAIVYTTTASDGASVGPI